MEFTSQIVKCFTDDSIISVKRYFARIFPKFPTNRPTAQIGRPVFVKSEEYF